MNTLTDFFACVYFILILVCHIHNVSSNESCYSCNGVPSERDCQNIVTCGPHEKCYTRAVTSDNGNVVYESGCMGLDTCRINELQNLGKRSIVTCFKCCNGTTATGDLCNTQQCSVTHTVNNRIRCYDCDDVDNPKDCSNSITCDLDEECFTSRFVNKASWRNVYELHCKSKSFCRTIESLVNLHPEAQCHGCCNSTLCNRKLCGLAALSKPDLSYKPNDRTVVEGDRIILRCEAFANAKATVSWSFQPSNPSGSSTVPANSYSPSNGTIAFIVKPEHSGQWTCTATNPAGSTSASAIVTVVPLPIAGKK